MMQTAFKEGGLAEDICVWKDFSPIVDSIAQKVAFSLTKGPYPIGPTGERVPYEARRRDIAEEDIFGRIAYHTGYARIGNIAFVDSRLKANIPDQVKNNLRESIIWLSGFQSEMGDFTHLPFTACTVIALISLNLKGKHVLDLGSGDGPLSLVAHRMGAAELTLVDTEEVYMRYFYDHLEANGIRGGNFNCIVGDITKPKTIISKLKSPIDIVVANIGPHYEDVHLKAIDLLAHLPSAETYIGGAYIKGHLTLNSREALDKLKQLGYSANFREVTQCKARQTFIVDKDLQ